MRPINESVENIRVEPLLGTSFKKVSCDQTEPEPVGTVVLIPLRIEEYQRTDDGLLMRVRLLNKAGAGAMQLMQLETPRPDEALVVSQEELAAMFRF